MFAVEIKYKEGSSIELEETIRNLISYIHNDLSSKEVRVVSDDNSVEIVSGSEIIPDESQQIVAELLIRKTVVINNEDFKDRSELDRYLTSIRHFCDQAKVVEDAEYLPINMREHKKK
jgi:hypothetical protein